MHREFHYIPPEYIRNDDIQFPPDETHHLSRVLRRKKNDLVWAVDGVGTAYEVRILTVSSKSVTGKIVTTRRHLGEPVIDVTLAHAVLKGERFDWVVEKCTELGVRRIIPMLTETTVAKATPQKQNRWKRIAVAAMKQSGRSFLPEVTQPKTFLQVTSMGAACKYRFIADESGKPLERCMREDDYKTTPHILLLVGPEGGFSEAEIERANDNGFTPIALGPRRLRSETAGIVLTALILSRLGELS